jgi:hypothetical protein
MFHRPRVPPGSGSPTQFIDVRRVRLPNEIIQIEEGHKTRPTHSLVAVGQWMIPRHVACKHSCFVDQVWVEVLTTEAGLRGVKC